MPRRPAARLTVVLGLGVALVLAVGGLAVPPAAAPAAAPAAVRAAEDAGPSGHGDGHGHAAADPVTAAVLGGTLLLLPALAVGFVRSGRRRRAGAQPAARSAAGGR